MNAAKMRVASVMGVAIAVTSLGVAARPGVAEAFFPSVFGTSVCNGDGTWTATWTATVDDDDPSYSWRVASPAGYSPAEWQPAPGAATRSQILPVVTESQLETVVFQYQIDGVLQAYEPTETDIQFRPFGCDDPPPEPPAVVDVGEGGV